MCPRRLRLQSPREKVHEFLATPEGRRQFWAETAIERDGAIEFVFSNGESWRSRILESAPPTTFAIEYFGGSVATFDLAEAVGGGTELTLTETGVPQAEWTQNHAGWVSLLLTLKAAVDFGVDLRNKDRERSWDVGYVDVWMCEVVSVRSECEHRHFKTTEREADLPDVLAGIQPL